MRRALAVAALVAAGLGVLAVWFYPSHADFQPDNPFWNGLGEFIREWNVTPLESLGLLPRNPLGTSLVVIPSRAFARDDTDRIQRYLKGGGVVILLDDFGFGNQVLEGLAVPARIAGSPLLDPLFNYKNRWLPEITDVSILPPGSAVIFNHASALTGTSGMMVVARSSRYSFLDPDGNGVADPGEPRGPLIVAAWVQVGRGVLFVASDPSFLINGMLGLGSNREFARKILQFAGNNPRVFLDGSHLPVEALVRAKTVLRSSQRLFARPVVLVTGLLLSAAAPLALALRRWK